MYKNVTLFCALALFIPGTLFAADSCENAETLKQCIDMNIATCREDAECEDDREQGITSSDITDEITETCCPKAAKKERKCLKREKRKIRQTRKRAPKSLKPFIRQLVEDIKDIDCSTNTTNSF